MKGKQNKTVRNECLVYDMKQMFADSMHHGSSKMCDQNQINF